MGARASCCLHCDGSLALLSFRLNTIYSDTRTHAFSHFSIHLSKILAFKVVKGSFLAGNRTKTIRVYRRVRLLIHFSMYCTLLILIPRLTFHPESAIRPGLATISAFEYVYMSTFLKCCVVNGNKIIIIYEVTMQSESLYIQLVVHALLTF